MASRVARHLTRVLPARLAMFALVTVVALGAAGWKSEAEAFRSLIDAYFQRLFAAGNDCEQLATSLQSWENDERAAADATVQALVDALGAVNDREELAQVEKFSEDLWETMFADRDKVAKFSACMSSNEDVARLVGSFDDAVSRPVSRAINDARVRVAEAEERARPADMPLAELAGETFARLMGRYREVVEIYHASGCDALSDAHDYWYGNYFEAFDQSAQTLMTEIGQMTQEQFDAFKASKLATLATDKAAFDTAVACVGQLEGDDAKYLDRQSSTLAFITEMVVLSAPLNRAP